MNVPVYGLALPLFEPVHDRVRQRPAALRAAVYGVGILGVEYASGRTLRLLVSRAPWDYGRARFAVHGLVRLDYVPLWAAYGLGLERLHDLLIVRVATPIHRTRDQVPRATVTVEPFRSRRARGAPQARAARALAQLLGTGLVDRGEAGLRIDLGALREAARAASTSRRRPALDGATAEQAAVARNFVTDEGRIRALPAGSAERRLVLGWVANRFARAAPAREGGQRPAARRLRRRRVAP